MAQQMSCTFMVALVTICQPYKATFLNYVDILIFTNLAALNSMSHYLFETLKNHEHSTPSRSVFALQYALVFIPLIYMLVYVLWRKTVKYYGPMKRTLFEKFLKRYLTSPRYQQLEPIVGDNPSADTGDPVLQHGDDLDTIIERSKDRNLYRSQVPVTVVGTDEGEASIHRLPHESEECAKKFSDSGMHSGGCVLHRNTNSGTTPSDGTDSGYPAGSTWS